MVTKRASSFLVEHVICLFTYQIFEYGTQQFAAYYFVNMKHADEMNMLLLDSTTDALK